MSNLRLITGLTGLLVAAGLAAFVACGSDPADGYVADAGGSVGKAGSGGGGKGGTPSTGGASGGGAGANGGSSSGGAGGANEAGAGAAGVSGSAGSGGAAGGTAEVRFVGRTDTRQANVVKMAWSGSRIIFRFSGTQASVRLDDRAAFWTVLVDGQIQPRLSTSSGERSYEVARGLSAGQHEVQMYRRTEAHLGETRYLGVELGANGMLLPPPPAPARRIEVIGDSITCGYGNEGPDQNCPFTPDTENHYATYAAIAARNLQADLFTVAWSGKGVIFNYGTDRVDPLPALYDRALPQDASSVWDFSKWQPDVVVINLGTNDFSTDGDPSEAEFSAAYRAFLQHVRQKYPNAWIICLVPTLLGGADQTTAESYITRVVTALSGAGDNRLQVHALQFQQTGLGCDWHPSIATHASMGQALTQQLKSVLGW